MKKQIFIPSYKRPEKLLKTLNGLLDNIYGSDIKIDVIFSDTDLSSYNFVFKELLKHNNQKIPESISFIFMGNKSLPNKMNTYVSAKFADIFLMLTDDLIFEGTQIIDAFKYYEDNFKDLDVVMSLKSLTVRKSIQRVNDYSYVMVGNNFINRFPNRQLWCPVYNHYRFDKELRDAAIKLKKWHYFQHQDIFRHDQCEISGGSLEDGFEVQDYKKISADRKAKGWVWGLNFEL
jgi:hypothetical protein